MSASSTARGNFGLSETVDMLRCLLPSQVGLHIRCIAAVGDMARLCCLCREVFEPNQEVLFQYSRYGLKFAFHYNCWQAPRALPDWWTWTRMQSVKLEDLDKLPEEDKKLFVGSVPDKKLTQCRILSKATKAHATKSIFPLRVADYGRIGARPNALTM